jgi:hypothetical protein
MDTAPSQPSTPISPPATAPATTAPEAKPRFLPQAVTGVTPPQLGEARIREVWPSLIVGYPGLTSLVEYMLRSIILAPVAWIILLFLFGKKFSPFICKRYTLTNRRLMVQRGLKPHPVQEIALADIDDVRQVPGTYYDFFQAGSLEIVSRSKGNLTLGGVPEPESFRQAIINACAAWVPGKAKTFGAFIAASAKPAEKA